MFGWSFEGDYHGGQPQLFIKLGTAMNDAEGWGCLGPERAQTLIVLANYVDPMGIAFPGNKELAAKLRVSEKAAQERISALLSFRYTFDKRGKMQETTQGEGRPLVTYSDEEGNLLPERQRDEQGRWKKRYLRILAPIRFGNPDNTKTNAQLKPTSSPRKVASSRQSDAKGQVKSTLRPATSGSTGVELEPYTKQEPDKTTRQSGLVESPIDDLQEPDMGEPPDKVQRVLGCFTDIVGRSPTTLERQHLIRLMASYGWWDVETALNELLVQQDQQRIKNPTRYLAGILENWTKEGPRNTNIVAHLKRMASRE